MLIANPKHATLKMTKKVDAFFHQVFAGQLDPAANPLFGDRCVEYAFVVQQLIDEDRSKSVLDVGSCGSPLTTIIKDLGFASVDAIDILPSPLDYEGVRFLRGDFLSSDAMR